MLSVVIPIYNEENAIGATVDEVKNILGSINEINDYEIILVNDGSSDNTSNVIENIGGIKVITHPHNIGYGGSLKSGIKVAKYDTIVITDADRTYPFNRVSDLLEEYNKGFDMVVGARTGQNYKESLFKYPLRCMLKFLVEFTAGRKIPDINSGLRIFSKKTSSKYLSTLCDTFSFTTSITLAYMMTSKFVAYVPIEYNERDGSSKVRLFRDSIRTLQYILQAINYYNPIKIFVLFAMFCLLASLGGFTMAAIFKLKSAFYLGIGGMLVSLIVLCFGLIADLLKQIMDKNDQR